VEVNARDLVGAGKDGWDLAKVGVAVKARWGVIAMKRGASCGVLIDRLEACAGRRTAALTGKVAVPGIEANSKTVTKGLRRQQNMRCKSKKNSGSCESREN
jgi:hypothetical protein